MGKRRVAVAALTMAAAGGLAIPLVRTAAAVAPRAPRPPSQVTSDDGLHFRLSDAGAEEGAPAVTGTPAAPATPLSDAEADRLLSRLSPLAAPADEQRDWAIREKSLPPPRTGATVKTPFPPPATAEGPPAVAAGPLRVLRRSPDGAVPLAPHLSVTFSQPMVAVTAHADLARERPPVRLDPEPPGRWRWVGSQTVLFEPEGRFPMATTYTAEVPSGVRSATGAALEAGVRWTFTTPPPALVDKWPDGIPVRRRPTVIAVFDQRVDPAAVLATVRLKTGGREHAVRLATAEEIAAEPDVARRAKHDPPGRVVALVPQQELPADAAVTVEVGPGTPSAEGPRRTEQVQSWAFRTYGPMRVTEHRCGWEGRCPPGTPWQVQFSNPVDPARFREDMVSVTPALPAMRVDVHGQMLVIRGRSRGRATYTVRLSAELPDTFGQTLGGAEPLSFAVSAADPALWAPGGDFVALEPAAGGRFSVLSVNQDTLRVRVHAVGIDDWDAYRAFRRERFRDRSLPPLPGRPAFTRTVEVRGRPDEMTETAIDLSAALSGGTGHALVVVEPATAQVTGDAAAGARRPRRTVARVEPVIAWVQATRIGLQAMVDGAELIAWASDLADGRPLRDVRVRLWPGGAEGVTGADGLARLPLADAPDRALLAQSGRDLALLPDDSSWWSDQGSWRRVHPGGVHRFFVLDDRHLYRPKEEVKLKGWVRSVDLEEGGDVLPWVGNVVQSVAWTLNDSQGNEVGKGTAPVGAFGSFDFPLALPATMNLGPASVRIVARDAGGRALDGHETTHSFQVQEFRRPEFEVKVEAAAGPWFVGTHTTASVTAAYFAGGALADTEVSWQATASPGSYRPPNRDDFTFGTWVPWWEPWRAEPGGQRTDSFSARTDSAGRHRLRIDLDRVSPPRPSLLRVEATVMDVNRQAWTDGASLLVHPAALYVGLRTERPFVGRGEPLPVEAVVTDLDGAAVAGRSIDMKAERLDSTWRDGRWSETVAESEPCAAASGPEAVACTFRPREGGVWRITARVQDDQGRPNETQLRVWVAGDKAPPARGVEEQRVTLVPDRKEYRAGDVARLLVVAPFAPAEGVLSLRRSGIVRTERFRMTGATHTLQVPIEEGYTPNVHAQVDLVGNAPRQLTEEEGAAVPDAPPRPAYATGIVNLPVPPLSRTLKVTASPRDPAVEPGGQTVVDLQVAGPDGRPVAGAELVVIVADEAVLALSGYRLPDPLAVFYAQREPGARDHSLRRSVVLGRPEELEGAEGGVAGGVMAEQQALDAFNALPAAPAARAVAKERRAAEAAPAPIRTRADWSALAVFAPAVVTDAAGRAQVPVTVPDNLTRYRVMAVAATRGREFGGGESTLTARLPLMVRASPPRFLNFGDRFELPVVVQNQTASALSVDVAVRAANASLTGPRGLRVAVPANDRVEVRFPAAAARPGAARFQLAAASGRFADASEHSLPVWTPATTEAFATYGTVDDGAAVQPVKAPGDAIPDFGGLEVTTSSTALSALTDAVLYLVAYPFECSEQVASRVLGVAALRDVLAAFRAEGLPEPEAIASAMDRDIALLRRLQNDDGGWPFWRRGDESWPYLSIHAAHALQRAKEKGFAVPDETLGRAREYLRTIESRYPSWYDARVRRTLTAYALHVRHRMGDRDPAQARRLVQGADLPELPLEAAGWLLPVLGGDAGSRAVLDQVRRHLANRAVETAATAHFAESYGELGPHVLLHSDRRADAVILEALIGDQPSSTLVPKLVEGLLGHRKKGRWENTQENAFVLLALDRYFQAYEKTTPDFVARLWLGDRYAGEHAFRGRSADRQHVDIPMRAVAAAPADFTIAKEGKGRLYYRIGLQYAPASLELAAADHGFTVERRYEAVDDPAHVRRDADGTWRIRAGARVRVTVTVVSPSRRYHVALVDPLPAGLETLNPELATTGTIGTEPPDTVNVEGGPGLGGRGGPGHWWWWRRPWFDHQNMRDERVEAFAALMWEGVWTYRYLARATTPGAFVAPPPRAEEMYHPETFGRGATGRVVVE